MTPRRWLTLALVYAVHDRQIAEHGGRDGIRDRGAIESAAARPRNVGAYGNPDVAACAAAYAFGFTRNHGFIDGNKRTAWVLARVFLSDNGYALKFERADAIRTMEALAAGTIEEPALAQWFRARLARAARARPPRR
ncbi:MAG: type II toxin-antitoxin system death-on-curing family toxin [Vulcanimicrobiaceae bacterium]